MHELEDVDRVLHSLRGVWDEEAVDELDHALQSAARAVDDGADDELVLAAALHDVAHSPLFNGLEGVDQHDRFARDWLTPRFGERVGWLAGAHVAAKRYLAATEPGYALSDVSALSLQHQGGPGVERRVHRACVVVRRPAAPSLRRRGQGSTRSRRQRRRCAHHR